MDKTIKKTIVHVENKSIKDRGDLKKMIAEKIETDDVVINQSFLPDQGDSARKHPILKPDKKQLFDKKRNKESHLKNADANIERELFTKNVPILGKEIKFHLDLEGRKRIRDKYTFNLRNLNQSISSNINKKDDVKVGNIKVEIRNADKIIKKLSNDDSIMSVEKPNGSSNDSGKSGKKNPKPEKGPCVQRKPVIKTIMSKNDRMKIYKAVTFVEQQKCELMPLQINIPTEVVKKNVARLTDTSSLKNKMKPTVSRVSIKEKLTTVRKKPVNRRYVKNRHTTSPDTSALRNNRSPPTEVAKWAPSSINRHTKPYYEAWVDTTLAAISKNYKNDQLYLEKQNIIKTFQTALEERPISPELVYEKFSDEKYTGKIKVRQG